MCTTRCVLLFCLHGYMFFVGILIYLHLNTAYLNRKQVLPQAVGWPADCFKDWRYLPPPVVPQKAEDSSEFWSHQRTERFWVPKYLDLFKLIVIFLTLFFIFRYFNKPWFWDDLACFFQVFQQIQENRHQLASDSQPNSSMLFLPFWMAAELLEVKSRQEVIVHTKSGVEKRQLAGMKI